MQLPVLKAVVVPARAAYSHSALVGSRQVCPVLRLSQVTYCWASSQETLITGCRPRPQPSSAGRWVQPPSATQASHSSNVTSYFPNSKAATWTRWAGFSLS